MHSLFNPFHEIASQCLVKVPAFVAEDTDKASLVVSTKEDGDPSTAVDILAEDIACDVLKALSGQIDFYSEERGYLIKSNNPEYLIQMDPVDGTYLALRQLPGSCMAITAFRNGQMKPVCALVADYYNGDIYWADETGSTLNGKPVHPSNRKTLREALVSTCYGKRSRFGKILDDPRFIDKTFWISTNGGILDMVRVATGQIDAYLDLMLGYKTYDFSAGAYIAEKAGACVTNEHGEPLIYPEDVNQRCKFIIAANKELLGEIIQDTVYNDQTPLRKSAG